VGRINAVAEFTDLAHAVCVFRLEVRLLRAPGGQKALIRENRFHPFGGEVHNLLQRIELRIDGGLKEGRGLFPPCQAADIDVIVPAYELQDITAQVFVFVIQLRDELPIRGKGRVPRALRRLQHPPQGGEYRVGQKLSEYGQGVQTIQKGSQFVHRLTRAPVAPLETREA